MKGIIIVALVSLNAALLVALVFGASVPAAQAQVIGGGTDYLMLTGDIGNEYYALYILDLGRRRLAAMRFDRTRKRMLGIARRDLPRDFGRSTQ